VALYCVTAPTIEPITLDEAKAHLRVDHTADDGLIVSLIAASRQWAEARSGRAFITQTWDYKLDFFPVGWAHSSAAAFSRAPIILPKPPLQSITSVQYVATNQQTATWSSSLYTVTRANTKPVLQPWMLPGNVQPAYGQFYPVTLSVPEAVTIRMVCGYGDAPTDVPEGIRRAMLIRLGDLYQRREPTVESRFVDTKADELMLAPFVSKRFD
jgi:uncharacterized phiE125 gp8 family phage protein